MKLGRVFGFWVLVLFLVPLAKADGPVYMQFVGANGVNNGQYYVSPYFGTMNGQQVTLFCDDLINDVNFGQTWWANVTNLGAAVTTNNFSQTRYGTVGAGQLLTSPAIAYEEAAWLASQFPSNPGDLVNLQYALWDIMNPGSSGYVNGVLIPDVQNWLTLASQNYRSVNLSNYEIVTNVGPLSLTGQVQEFIVPTPEPGTLALLICGILALAVRLLNRGRLTT